MLNSLIFKIYSSISRYLYICLIFLTLLNSIIKFLGWSEFHTFSFC